MSPGAKYGCLTWNRIGPHYTPRHPAHSHSNEASGLGALERTQPRGMWPFKPRPTRPSACPPVRTTGGLLVRPSTQSTPTAALPPLDRPVCPSARSARSAVLAMAAPTAQSARPRLLGLVRASSARPRVRASWALPSARPLDYPRLFCPHLPDRLVSALPPIRPPAPCTHRPPRPFARTRQPPLYIPHPTFPQIIQLLAVRIGPRVSVAPLRTAALRGVSDHPIISIPSLTLQGS